MAILGPADGRFTDTSVSTTSTDEIAFPTWARGKTYSFVSTVTFNLTMGDDDHTEPAAAYMFAAGVVHTFEWPKSATHFRLRASGSGTIKHWSSSYE